jgi:hypothetical protein
VAYEIKQGEVSKGKAVLTNESAGLILLLMDLAQPWSCPQKYKVMDELHSDIFGRPDVIGTKILGYRECFSVVESIDDNLGIRGCDSHPNPICWRRNTAEHGRYPGFWNIARID